MAIMEKQKQLSTEILEFSLRKYKTSGEVTKILSFLFTLIYFHISITWNEKVYLPFLRNIAAIIPILL